MPKHEKFPLVVTSSKEGAFFESVVCLIKLLRRRRSYLRQMEWNYIAEFPKFLMVFFGKTLLSYSYNVFLDTDKANQSNLTKNSFKRLESFPIEGQIYRTQKKSFGKVPFAINSLNEWNNYFLTVPEVIHRKSKSFSTKVRKWILQF